MNKKYISNDALDKCTLFTGKILFFFLVSGKILDYIKETKTNKQKK